ncbi:hypothetical protein Pa4123_36310 [Phytohabitans aurantiacus]|uniref:Uncharacterized protein n=1 Tax=Phytohabitans aurantiacus TaxID=3016789 RepID=A0ABQ5QWT1_9ACTN|nr:hypothetical protein Pa4123_36310 [Phytohabitans aurantiacus]
MRRLMCVKRTTVTLDGEAERVVEESGAETALRRLLEEWVMAHGESVDVLRSEGGRIRTLLQVAGEALHERALDIGYTRMAEWYVDTDPPRRAARDRWVGKEAERWAVEDAVR